MASSTLKVTSPQASGVSHLATQARKVPAWLFYKLVPVSFRYDAAKSRFLGQNAPSALPDDPTECSIAEELNDTGIYIWENYIDRNRALALGKQLKPILDELRDGAEPASNQFLADPSAGLYRIMNVSDIVPETADLLGNPAILRIAQAVTSSNVVPFMKMAEMREGLTEACSEDCWHFDEPYKHKFKFFLLLTDVTEDNAPFSYVKKSHKTASWRRPKELDAYKYGYDGNWGFYHQHEFDSIMNGVGRQLGFEKVTCTGPAGTMILFNANGLHRRELLRKDYRIIVSNYYQVPRK